MLNLSTTRIKGGLNFDKLTSRETAFDSYKLPIKDQKSQKDPKETDTWRNTSSSTLNHTIRTPQLNHSINFGKQSDRFKVQRSKNGSVKVLTLYTPNYDSVSKRTAGMFDFGKTEGRENSLKATNRTIKVNLSEGIKKLMLQKAIKSEGKPNSFNLKV